jgi:S-adenosylmethionine hydrolase
MRSRPSQSHSRSRPPIALLTDFGYRDHYAGVMKGVIATIAPETRVIDLTHGIAPQSIIEGAIVLRESWRYFPPRTIFLAVVDPGVGTDRAAIAIETRAGARFVGPDNGLMWMAANAAGIKRIVKLTELRYRLPEVSSTFHGRDIFAPAAARLSRGVRVTALGPVTTSITKLELPMPVRSPRELKGEVVYVDGFGNLITNLDRASVDEFCACFPAKSLSVRLKRSAAVRIVDAYGRARKGVPLAIFGSFGLLEVAVRDGNAATRLGLAAGAPVSLRPDAS